MTAGIGVASRFVRVLDRWLAQYPAAARPHIDGVIAQINADGTARVLKPGHQYASAYNYALPVPDPTRPWKVGDPVQLDESNSRRPRISTIPLPAVVTDVRFASPPTTAYPAGQYGADPTGITDSYPQIIAAQNALPTSGGTLYFQAGTYKLGQPWVPPYYVSIDAEPGTTFIPGWSMAPTDFLISTPSGSGSTWPTYRGFGVHGLGAGNGLLIAWGHTRVFDVQSWQFAGDAFQATAGFVLLQDCVTDTVATGIRLLGTEALVLGGDLKSHDLVISGTSRAQVIGLQNIDTLRVLSSATQNLVMGGNANALLADNSSLNTVMNFPMTGNLTEQNGATANQYIWVNVGGTMALAGTSFLLGRQLGGQAALRLYLASGSSVPPVEAVVGGTSVWKVDAAGAETLAGDVTYAGYLYNRAAAVTASNISNIATGLGTPTVLSGSTAERGGIVFTPAANVALTAGQRLFSLSFPAAYTSAPFPHFYWRGPNAVNVGLQPANVAAGLCDCNVSGAITLTGNGVLTYTIGWDTRA